MASDKIGAEIEASEENEVSSGRGFASTGQYLLTTMIEPFSRCHRLTRVSNHLLQLLKVKVDVGASNGSEGSDGRIPNHGIANGSQNDSKLELFGFDSLVNILGLKSMAGDQIQAPSSLRDGVDVSVERPQANSVKLGTMMGVFVPCLQNILGIIYYIRFSWIVGMAGIGQSLLLVAFCGSCTFLTTISLSAIATNGAMKGGGPYYLIGRALGPEVGVSIGLCFFLGNAVAGALIDLKNYESHSSAAPDMAFCAGVAMNSAPVRRWNLSLECCATSGATLFIDSTIILFFLFIYLFFLCIIIDKFLYNVYYRDKGWRWPEHANLTVIFVLIIVSALVGLFFPAVTGIMAGSNRSASLKDTQRSIPVGTLAATLTTSGLYLVSVLFFGALATRQKLLTDRLLTATVAWPFPSVIYIGIILSTLGAALQSLTGAPRLLAAIANDDILPVLIYFKVADGSEPHIATLFTAFLCIGCVVIGNLDLITPTVTMFYLLCYGGVNLSSFLLDLLDAPSWRPRWKFHHWSISLVGALICIVIMFLISWTFTVVSLALATLIYYYVSIKGKAGNWGDGFKNAYFQLALRSLRSLGASQVHPKNWYPIPLVFCRPWGKLPENVPCHCYESHPKLADFANFMKKKGRGMSIFVSIIDGDYHEMAEEAKSACRALSTYIEYKQCEGVAEIVVAPTMSDGFRGIDQTMGLGNLKPNIVVMRYPEIWRRENLTEIPATFVGIINDCIVANKAVVIVKGLDEWPNEYQRQYGTIDLYWIVRDGGLMLLLSQLLLTKESFESCKIQVFCIAEEDSDAEELKTDVKKFLYDLRMQAEVIVISMKSWDARAEQQDDSMEAFSSAQERISGYLASMKKRAEREGTHGLMVNEQQVEKFLYMMLKLNSTILKYSRMAAVVLVSLPPPPLNHPSYFYMEYMDLLVENVPRLLVVRGYRKDVVTLFT
ncbi:Cation-chloride cotransporter 1 [Striga hermonthica]|uniref:Cation-chloride cotransporter 1 n=1 Tax=Striga hermonthica TaxID=68872 RepID=A0A9N7NA60_STRHE|nr:Cation-chloride cotransporter 1 [Striga hermonthica]